MINQQEKKLRAFREAAQRHKSAQEEKKPPAKPSIHHHSSKKKGGSAAAKAKTTSRSRSSSSSGASSSNGRGPLSKKQPQEPMPPYVSTDSANSASNGGSTSPSDEGRNGGSSSDEAMEVAETMTAMSQGRSRSSCSLEPNSSSSDRAAFRGPATKKNTQEMPPYVTTNCAANAEESTSSPSDEATCPSYEATRNEGSSSQSREGSSSLSEEDDTGSDQSVPPHPHAGSSNMPLRKRFRAGNNLSGITQRNLADHNVRMQMAEDMKNEEFGGQAAK